MPNLNFGKYSSFQIFQKPGNLRATIVRGWRPVDQHIVMKYVGHLAAEGRGGLVWAEQWNQACFYSHQITHDIDMNVPLILTLGIPEDHFVGPWFLPPRIYDWEINIVPSEIL